MRAFMPPISTITVGSILGASASGHFASALSPTVHATVPIGQLGSQVLKRCVAPYTQPVDFKTGSRPNSDPRMAQS
jgi:hypothetical protein